MKNAVSNSNNTVFFILSQHSIQIHLKKAFKKWIYIRNRLHIFKQARAASIEAGIRITKKTMTNKEKN